MEIYFQTSQKIYLYVYVNGVLMDADSAPLLTITRLLDNTEIVSGANPVHEATGTYSYALSTSDNSNLSKFKAVWTYIVGAITNTKTTYYDVVVGYASAQEVKSDFSELASKSNDDIYRKEKIARKIINNFCGQSFDFEDGTQKKVIGQDEDTLYLPKRITVLTQVLLSDSDPSIGSDVTSDIEIDSDYFLRATRLDSEIDVKKGILSPGPYFLKGSPYYVTGTWGWESVPDDIQTACRLLIRDYFDDDNLLRQHGVIRASLGDSNYRFRDDLWATTGNYDVDILLQSYTLTSWTVI